jgi:adenylate kinase family enzyme
VNNWAEGIGRRIHVAGNSCSGKSILGEQLAGIVGGRFIDLDGLNWLPNWHGLNEHDPAELDRRIIAATDTQSWVLAGSYMNHCQRTCWAQLQTIVWLDLPLTQLLRRMFRRSWRRWRSKELLWGTNYEKFWPQLAVWRKEDSLLWWIVTTHKQKRASMIDIMSDPQWSHIKVIRLTSSREIDRFMQNLRRTYVGFEGALVPDHG